MEATCETTIGQWLEADGWRPSHDGDPETYWWKRFDAEPRCRCNDDKPGVQLVIKEHDLRRIDDGLGVSYSIDLRAESGDGVWISFECYSLRADDLRKHRDSQVAKLIRAWQAANAGEHQPRATEGETP